MSTPLPPLFLFLLIVSSSLAQKNKDHLDYGDDVEQTLAPEIPKAAPVPAPPGFSSSAVDLTDFMVPLNRLYNHRQLKHHFHSDQGITGVWKGQGFYVEGPLGRVIDPEKYRQNKVRIDPTCGALVQLYSFVRNNVQFLTTNTGEAQKKRAEGWQELKSIGYCASYKTCGASKPLKGVTVIDGSDSVYSTDEYEISVLNGIARFKGTATSVICYLF